MIVSPYFRCCVIKWVSLGFCNLDRWNLRFPPGILVYALHGQELIGSTFPMS